MKITEVNAVDGNTLSIKHSHRLVVFSARNTKWNNFLVNVVKRLFTK